MSTLTEILKLNLPDLILNVAEEVGNEDPASEGACKRMFGAVEVFVNHLMRLTLSEYRSTCQPEDAGYSEVVKSCQVGTRTIGQSADLLCRCLDGLHRKHGNRRFVLSGLSWAHPLKDVGPFCALWDEICKEAKRMDRGERVTTYGQVSAKVGATGTFRLGDFVARSSNLRNVVSHEHSETANGEPQNLELTDNFYSVVNPPLAQALGAFAVHVADVLSQSIECETIRLVDGAAVVKPKRRGRARPSIHCGSREIEKGSMWYVALDSKPPEFLFPAIVPASLAGPTNGAGASAPSEKRERVKPGDQPEASGMGGAKLGRSNYGVQEFRDNVEEGLFTPVIGPGCYRVRGNIVSGRAHVVNRAELLGKRLASALDRDYLMSAVNAGFGNPDAEQAEMYDTGDVAATLPFEQNELPRFQAAIISLAVALTRVISDAMRSRPEAIIDLAAFRVVIGRETWKSEKIPNLLARAIECANQLSNAPQAKDVELGLGPVGILNRLEAWSTSTKEHDASVFLPLAQLEWLGDLLWHTLRFRAPLYPSPDALAFQISAWQADPQIPGKHTVGTAASSFESERLARMLRQWLPLWAHSEGAMPSALDDAVARLLIHAQAVTADAAAAARPVDRRPLAWPIALDTTFEDGLELALEARGVPYHVAFPASVWRDNPKIPPLNCWILYSKTSLGEAWRCLGDASSDQEVSPRLSTKMLTGPLVVKLNGSPLTSLPNAKNGELAGIPFEDWETIDHRVVASYSEAIRAIVDASLAMPDGLREMLQTRGPKKPSSREGGIRVLGFLGFRLTDSTSRLRISSLRDPASTDRDSAPRLLFVDSPRDPMQHAILSLDQRVFDERLERIPRHINDCSLRSGGGR